MLAPVTCAHSQLLTFCAELNLDDEASLSVASVVTPGLENVWSSLGKQFPREVLVRVSALDGSLPFSCFAVCRSGLRY